MVAFIEAWFESDFGLQSLSRGSVYLGPVLPELVVRLGRVPDAGNALGGLDDLVRDGWRG